MHQLPCEIEVSEDISPSRIRRAFVDINVPDKGAVIRANWWDICRWENESLVVMSITPGHIAGSDTLKPRRVTMAGFEMVEDNSVTPGKLMVMPKD